MNRKLLTFLALPFAACASLAGYAVHAEAPAAKPVATAPATSEAPKPDWAFEHSDLPVDPAFRFGKLPNGMRYIIRKNGTPAGQGEVRLYIGSGSLSEHDDERGYAHFIEHMAFNGSTHVPEGDMVKLLEREGLAFGADTNASTNFDVTLYQLDLPRNDAELLDTALFLMRETASELTFKQDAVDRERGVVLSEKRVRDTYAFRNLVDTIGFLYPGSKASERLPIGLEATLDAATSAKLKTLYQRLYTPANAVVIVVGDFDPDVVEAKIKAHFSDWAPAPAPADADYTAGPVDPGLAGKTEVYVDPALSEEITAARSGAYQDEPDNVADRKETMLRQIGYAIVNRRLQRLVNSDSPPFKSASLSTQDLFKAGRTTSLTVDTGDGEWRTGLLAATAEYRRALTYGFTDAEIAEQLAIIRTNLQNGVAGAATYFNRTHTANAIRLVHDDIVPTTPQTDLDLFNAMAGDVTPDTVLAALKREAIPLDKAAMLRFQGRAAPGGGEAEVRAAWDEAMAAPVEKPAAQATRQFGYTDFGTPGTVVADTVEPGLGIRELRFSNGVRLNLKKTDIKQDRVLVQVTLDGGDMLNTKDHPLATALTSVLPLGGLGKHSFDELQTILAGRTVGFNINSDTDSFRMSAGTTPRDLGMQLELFAAAITDPGYRATGEQQFQRFVTSYFASKDATPERALDTQWEGILSDSDPRFTLQSEAAYHAQDFAKLRAAIADRLAHGAIEIAIVGDFDEDQAIALVARTFGALPQREPDFLPYKANRERSFTADRSLRVLHHDGGADQAAIRITWPTRDDSDPVEELKLKLLQNVMRLDLLDVLREALGKTYSPQVAASESRDYPGFGTFMIGASVATADVPAARTAMERTVAGLRDKPVDDDTLLRARQPMIEMLDNALKTNEGWMSLVDRAQSEPDRIARYLAAKKTLEGLTAADVQAMAQRYLDPAKGLEIDVLPKEGAPAGDE